MMQQWLKAWAYFKLTFIIQI